jgi:hypothetical protein
MWRSAARVGRRVARQSVIAAATAVAATASYAALEGAVPAKVSPPGGKAGADSSPSSVNGASSASSTRPSRPIDIAAVNAAADKVRARRIARGRIHPSEDDDEVEDVPSPSQSSTEAYTYRPSPSSSSLALPATPSGSVVEVRTKTDVAAIDREISLVSIVRGCHPSIASEIVNRAREAASRDGLGFRFYAVTDSTPTEVVQFLEKALDAELPEPYAAASAAAEKEEGGAAPIVAVFDRPGKTRRKFFFDASVPLPSTGLASSPAAEDSPPSLLAPLANFFSKAAEPAPASVPAASSTAASSSSSSAPLSPFDAAALSLAPTPDQLRTFLGAFAHSQLKPTLIGAPRPAGDVNPYHPSLTQVVASSWEELVLDPKHDVLLEAYLTHCPMCMCLAPRVKMLAHLAEKYFPTVKVAAINIDENDRPLEWMPGPAFPTIQLFNAGSSESTPATSRFTKLRGPTCTGKDATIHLPAPESFEGSHGNDVPAHSHAGKAGAVSMLPPSTVPVPVARTTFKGSPPCVPAVDFTHPTVPGKMALPSVTELLAWVATHSSRPFDPSSIFVPESEVKGATVKYADMLPAPPQSAASQSPLATSGPGAQDAHPNPPRGKVSLLALASDMDAEARVIEYAIFDLMFFEHIANLYGKATGVLPAPGAGEGIGAGPLPDFATAQHRDRYLPFKDAIERLRHAAVEKGSYGHADEALDAMDACSSLTEQGGLRMIASKYAADQEDMKTIAAAMPLATTLAADEGRGKKGAAKLA